MNEFNKSKDCANLLSIDAMLWEYELTRHIDVQGDEDAVDDGDTILGLRNALFILTISVSEVKNNKTEPGEGKKFNEHSS